MRKPTILTLVYLGIAALWQVILWKTWPNVGMGGLAIIYIVWPLLFFSGGFLFWALRQFHTKRIAIFIVTISIMVLATLALHPSA